MIMNKKPDAIVFFDLDGTLLNSDVEVVQSSVDAIAALYKNNVMPIISTGRTVCEVASIMEKTAITSIIAMNGQSVFYQNNHVFSNNIDKTLISRVLDFSQQKTNIPLSFYNDNMMRISEDSKPADTFYRYIRQNKPAVDPDVFKTNPIQMMLLLCENGESIYIDEFPELSFIRNTPYCVDVFNKGGSKGFGIKKLLEYKSLYDVPTYAFGDGLNDIEMFQTVDHPIAMANAVEPIKAIAEFVTDNNDNDGIAKGLKQAGLI